MSFFPCSWGSTHTHKICKVQNWNLQGFIQENPPLPKSRKSDPFRSTARKATGAVLKGSGLRDYTPAPANHDPPQQYNCFFTRETSVLETTNCSQDISPVCVKPHLLHNHNKSYLYYQTLKICASKIIQQSSMECTLEYVAHSEICSVHDSTTFDFSVSKRSTSSEYFQTTTHLNILDSQ